MKTKKAKNAPTDGLLEDTDDNDQRIAMIKRANVAQPASERNAKSATHEAIELGSKRLPFSPRSPAAASMQRAASD